MTCSRLLRSYLKLVLMFSLLLPEALISSTAIGTQTARPRFKAIAIAEAGGIHKPFVDAAKLWLDKRAAEENFAVDYIQDTNRINDQFLSQYQVFIQLNYPPYGMELPGRGGVHQVY